MSEEASLIKRAIAAYVRRSRPGNPPAMPVADECSVEMHGGRQWVIVRNYSGDLAAYVVDGSRLYYRREGVYRAPGRAPGRRRA